LKKFWLVLFVVGLTISACAPKADTAASLTRTWKLVSYGPASNPTAALPDKDATITFGEDGQVDGNVGCNSFGGRYTVADGKITFEPLVSTMMACLPDALMNQEQAVLGLLSGSVDYKIEGSTLTITNNGSVLILEAVNGK
jgi:heat shock protein HslJ